ncbi:unnamed protein product [Strongylus vulgaris]|uniref:START domain-containing protein n=1 Tax=Strongylus vulgaris TaxID=40348 RepID=A0A3P7IU64_STRVU|nr:unnamed protein product [Strongylus vulgaris]
MATSVEKAPTDTVAIGDEALKDLMALCDADEEGWKELWTDDGIVFHTKKGTEPCVVDIIRCRFTLEVGKGLEDTDLATVKAMVSPWLPYRIQWDDILQRCEHLQELDKGYHMIHHVTKKRFPLSSRDSVDVVATQLEPTRVLMVARSVPTAGPAPTSDVVRTYQHIGGYCFCTSGERMFIFENYGIFNIFLQSILENSNDDKGCNLKEF